MLWMAPLPLCPAVVFWFREKILDSPSSQEKTGTWVYNSYIYCICLPSFLLTALLHMDVLWYNDPEQQLCDYILRVFSFTLSRHRRHTDATIHPARKHINTSNKYDSETLLLLLGEQQIAKYAVAMTIERANETRWLPCEAGSISSWEKEKRKKQKGRWPRSGDVWGGGWDENYNNHKAAVSHTGPDGCTDPPLRKDGEVDKKRRRELEEAQLTTVSDRVNVSEPSCCCVEFLLQFDKMYMSCRSTLLPNKDKMKNFPFLN